MVHLYMISSLLGYPGQDVPRPESRERRPCTVILCVLCTETHSYPRFRPSYNDNNRQRPKRSIAAHTARHLEGLVISLSRLNLFRCLTFIHRSTQHAFHPKHDSHSLWFYDFMQRGDRNCHLEVRVMLVGMKLSTLISLALLTVLKGIY